MWIDDIVLARHDENHTVQVFQPKDTMVVLGSSNHEETEVNLTYCQSHNIPVLRRYGGGGTVVLYPGCLVVSYGGWVKDPYRNDFYFKLLNQAVINTLTSIDKNFSNLSQNGISDIVCGPKKVGGTSLFRSRQYLLYQASLLLNLDLELVSACLLHPTKEPTYRQGRSHADFLTDLATVSSQKNLTPQDLCSSFESRFLPALLNLAPDEFLPAQSDQFKSLRERLERAVKTG
jgi:lipoate---protein ligase